MEASVLNSLCMMDYAIAWTIKKKPSPVSTLRPDNNMVQYKPRVVIHSFKTDCENLVHEISTFQFGSGLGTDLQRSQSYIAPRNSTISSRKSDLILYLYVIV